ncbi:hypothetical protein [Mycolicibacterium sp. J2]|uniref:hypothetical protein n=1 Tax=Mycolicibacterium sp. J2 TaxID=2993511 RepID=UPI00224AB3BE|nr:hypothetical protein [Mycolicibacterium sp. J2]MCX2714214.1 hypothetical protein [Mycolicibacterium sp. J2]
MASISELRERRDIWGAYGWQVNGYGHLYKHMRRKYPRNLSGLPVIYLGEQYFGPLLPASEYHGEVFLDEVVALAFHGFPQVATLKWWPGEGYAVGNTGHVANGILVRHADGDPGNCRRDNVAWTADGEYFRADDERLLRPTGLHTRRKPPGEFPFSRHNGPRFTGSDNLPGWMPTESKRAAA